MGDDLAKTMFEAADLERHRDLADDLRRFTSLPIVEQDEWEAAARAARKKLATEHAALRDLADRWSR